MNRGFLLLCLCAIAPFTRAADNNVKVDNENARVLFVTSAPGAKSALHEHKMNRVMIYLDAGKIVIAEPNKKEETEMFKAGEMLWSPARGPHTSLNTSGHPVRIVEIELKSKPGASVAPKLPDLDPIKADPKHYKVELENDQVRVTRAKYAPHDKGQLHEHLLPRVVTFLTDANLKVTIPDGQVKMIQQKAGDITTGGPAKHQEENLSDQPFEVVVVEFKK
jgi:uncharacterized RmlC-like cupin family protein